MAKDLKKLVIVESPAKARKIGDYLGDGYIVEASVGQMISHLYMSSTPIKKPRSPNSKS